jgi:hypothetical protein
MRMGWLVTLVLVIAVTMPPIAVGQAQAQEAHEKTEKCQHSEGWIPTAEELSRIRAEHRKWVVQWARSLFSEQWAENHPEGRANLCNAKLQGAELSNADLWEAELNNANLERAELNNANLERVEVKDANFAFASLGGSIYAPASPPPNPYLEGIKGLSTVSFPEGSGLVQLRELLQKAGLRDLERQATYALESNRTRHAITGQGSNPVDRLEGAFKFLFFEVTTGYGLYPGRALRFIVYFGLVLILVYIWPIRFSPRRSAPASRPSGSIYRIWSTDRVETVWDAEHQSEDVQMRSAAKVERLVGGWWFAIRYALYFSLLSAFSIGWKDFNVGSWIARIQGREYALRATGWVRVVSGLQSLLSLYLLAIWALTYFGRPFQ